MSYWKAIHRSNFLIKLRSWEYWPFGIVQFPAIIYWLWLSLRARSLVFFSACNPGISMGGMFGESKYDILQKIPRQYVPPTIKVDLPIISQEVMKAIESAHMTLPLIFKPDIGERGYMVKRVDTEDDVSEYLVKMRGPFLIQELVTSPLEFGVFYLKYPDEGHGRVISLVGKEMLAVTGDGILTLQDLILANDRAKLQWEKLKVTYREVLNDVPHKGKRIELVSIGNHAMGTRFINANHLINDQLSKTFDSISNRIPGFYFGRFDLRCESLADLYTGNVRILELNGCGAEPAHIYDTDFSIWRAFVTLVRHWEHIFRIARANNQKGIPYVSHAEALAFYRKFRSAIK